MSSADVPERPEPVGLELADSEPTAPAKGTDLELADHLADHEVSPPPAVPDEPVAAAGPLGDLVAAHLQRVEVAMLARVLATTLAGALPPAMVQVERRRTLLERLRRRPGSVIGVSIDAGDRRLTFRAPAVGTTEATISHRVRGVVLSTSAVTVAEWLQHLAAVLDAASTGDAATRAALQQALLA